MKNLIVDSFMRPSGHLSSAIIIWVIISIAIHNLSLLNFSLFLIGTIFLDIDLLARKVLHQRNHRRYITHYPIFWLVIIIVSDIFSLSDLFWLSCGALMHLLTDFIDWGIPWIPTSSAQLLPHILTLQHEVTEERIFSGIYWSNNIMKSMEIMFFIFAILGSLLLPETFLVLFVIFGGIIYPVSLWDYHRGMLSLITE